MNKIAMCLYQQRYSVNIGSLLFLIYTWKLVLPLFRWLFMQDLKEYDVGIFKDNAHSASLLLVQKALKALATRNFTRITPCAAFCSRPLIAM